MTTSIELCGTRFENLNGPTHTGADPNFVPSFCVAVGLTIIPARSVSAAVSGANGADRVMTTLEGSGASTLVIGPSSLLRAEVLRVSSRSRLALTALASNGVPSAKVMPVRTGMVTVFPPSLTVGSAVASCGTIVVLWSTS